LPELEALGPIEGCVNNAKLRARIAPVTEALERGDTPAAESLLSFAKDRVTRKVLYDSLAEHDKVELFPQEHRTWEAFAEADLVAWLCHPNELGAPPDEIELTMQLPAPGDAEGPNRYFLLRFRTHPPHWAAGDGWMAGVAGPYDVEKEPEPHALGTFSRFGAYDSRRPEEHVEATHRPGVEAKG
jgi:hypothetical protein